MSNLELEANFEKTLTPTSQATGKVVYKKDDPKDDE